MSGPFTKTAMPERLKFPVEPVQRSSSTAPFLKMPFPFQIIRVPFWMMLFAMADLRAGPNHLKRSDPCPVESRRKFVGGVKMVIVPVREYHQWIIFEADSRHSRWPCAGIRQHARSKINVCPYFSGFADQGICSALSNIKNKDVFETTGRESLPYLFARSCVR